MEVFAKDKLRRSYPGQAATLRKMILEVQDAANICFLFIGKAARATVTIKLSVESPDSSCRIFKMPYIVSVESSVNCKNDLGVAVMVNSSAPKGMSFGFTP